MTAQRHAARPLILGRNGRTPKTLRNRLASAPMERNYGTSAGFITEQYIDYLVTRARAGLGMVTTEATFVRADGKGRTHQLGLHTDDMIPGLRTLTDALHAEGALAAVELNHGGRTAQAAVSGFKNVAPSPVGCEVAGGEIPDELTREGCLELVEAYAQAAGRAVAAGFDVINIHGAHGYLIHQFMSPISNHRTDEFGNPEYFMNLVIDAVRQAVPDTIVGMRVSVLEGPAEGITAAGQLDIIGKAHLDKLDFLDISAGSYEAGEWIVQSGEWKPGVLARYAKEYKRFGLPLGMAGRLNSPAIIEEVLGEGTCDFVSLARAIHADPAFVGGVLRNEPYRPCIACNVCIDNLGLGQVTCSVNPAVGRSRVPMPTPKVRAGSRVLVVGAGPAGLTAARELAQAGARVSVLDAGTRPGGQFAVAERMRSTPDFHRFTDWSAGENARLGNPSARPVDLDEQALTPKLAVSYQLNQRMSAFAQYAQGFRSPPFEDVNIGLEIPLFNYRALPNPDLQPETSDSFELGLRTRASSWFATLSAHYTKFEDFIESRVNIGRDEATGMTLFQSQNVERARMYGIELAATLHIEEWVPVLEGWSLALNAAWSRGENTVTDQPLNSVEPLKATLMVDYEARGSWGVRFAATGVASQDRVAEGATPLFRTEGYFVLDAFAYLALGDRGSINLGLSNLTDERYIEWTDVRGRASDDPLIAYAVNPGRNASLMLNWTF